MLLFQLFQGAEDLDDPDIAFFEDDDDDDDDEGGLLAFNFV